MLAGQVLPDIFTGKKPKTRWRLQEVISLRIVYAVVEQAEFAKSVDKRGVFESSHDCWSITLQKRNANWKIV